MYVEYAADDEMRIYCHEVNNYFSFLLLLYFCHYSHYKCGITGKLGTFSTRYNLKSLKTFIR